MPFKDKAKAAEAGRRHYARHREAVKKKVRDRKIATRNIIQEYKTNHPCSDCNRNYPYYVMDFDHIESRGKKSTDINHLLGCGYALSTILNEMEKCDLVCSNCHRIRTFTRKKKGSNPKKEK